MCTHSYRLILTHGYNYIKLRGLANLLQTYQPPSLVNPFLNLNSVNTLQDGMQQGGLDSHQRPAIMFKLKLYSNYSSFKKSSLNNTTFMDPFL